MQFVVQYHAGMCGTDVATLVEADSADEAVEQVVSDAWDWYWNFNDEDEDIEPELDIWAETYNPEKYDGILT